MSNKNFNQTVKLNLIQKRTKKNIVNFNNQNIRKPFSSDKLNLSVREGVYIKDLTVDNLNTENLTTENLTVTNSNIDNVTLTSGTISNTPSNSDDIVNKLFIDNSTKMHFNSQTVMLSDNYIL